MTLYLGIDLGTSGVKTCLIDEDNAVVAQATAPLTVSRPHPGWSEQDPADWVDACSKAISDLPQDLRRQVAGIGLSGQMHGATLLDATGKVLRPAILWNDGRSETECHDLLRAVPDFTERAGNMPMPGFTAPKLLWLQRNEPSVFNAIDRVLLPKDYIRFWLTGEFASDVSDSAGTVWLNIERRAWDDELLAATGLTSSQMPTVYESQEITGHLSFECAQRLGLPKVPVVAGAGDNAAGAVGVGAVHDGSALLSLGTSGVIFVGRDAYRPNPSRGVHTFCHARPGHWHHMSVILSAASAVDHVAMLTGFEASADLYSALGERRTLTGTEIYLPYLSGERTPHNDPSAKGAMFGITHNTDRLMLGQAALEGVAFALADGIDAIRETGIAVSELSVIGGGAKSDWWGEILAASLDVTLKYHSGADIGPAYGAARLALAGVNATDIAATCPPPPVVKTVFPTDELAEKLSSRRDTFKSLYPATASLMKDNSE